MGTNKKLHTSKIIRQFLGNRFSKKTEEKVQLWLIDDTDSKEKQEASFAFWNELEAEPDATVYQALERVNKKTGFSEGNHSIFSYNKLWRVAAVVIPLLTLVGSIYYFSLQKQMVQIATVYGETKQIILPDGSEVWLNSGTTIQYPEQFENDIRKIDLKGEAYFVVQKDASKPFVVNTNALSIKVLGTTFNVKAYPEDDKIVTTLNSGKIEVETNSKQSRILTPNEQLTYNSQTSEISVTKTFADDASGWVNGQLIFTNASLYEILQTLEKRFDVSFEMQHTIDSKESYTIKFLKNDSLEQILNVLKDVAEDFSYQQEGKKIKITTHK